MKLRVECGDMATRASFRPGMIVITMDEVMLQNFDSKEMLGQMDIKEVFEWLNEQGYTVSQEKAA